MKFLGLRIVGNERMEKERVEVMGRFDDASGGYVVRAETTLPCVIIGQFNSGNNEDDARRRVQKEVDAGTHEFTLMPPATQ